MDEEALQQQLCQWVQDDKARVYMLRMVAKLPLPQCYIAAGFVRNLVWDHIHHQETSALNDVDVIYFAPNDPNGTKGKEIEQLLNRVYSKVKWQVRNQALMHDLNQDPPYTSSADALTYWPEKETAIAIRLDEFQQLEVVAPFGLSSLFRGEVTLNPKRSKQDMMERVLKKKWLDRWPQLTIVMSS